MDFLATQPDPQQPQQPQQPVTPPTNPVPTPPVQPLAVPSTPTPPQVVPPVPATPPVATPPPAPTPVTPTPVSTPSVTPEPPIEPAPVPAIPADTSEPSETLGSVAAPANEQSSAPESKLSVDTASDAKADSEDRPKVDEVAPDATATGESDDTYEAILNKDILELLGATNLPNDQKQALYQRMLGILQNRTMLRIDDQLKDPADVEGWKKALDTGDMAKMDEFLKTKSIDLSKLLLEEAIKLKVELAALAEPMRQQAVDQAK